eukprot:1185179-Prorocentrum_minimum.AAC.1
MEVEVINLGVLSPVEIEQQELFAGEVSESPPRTRESTSGGETLTVIGLAVHRVTASGPNMDKSWVPDRASRHAELSFWESRTSLLLVTVAMRQTVYPLYVLYTLNRGL